MNILFMIGFRSEIRQYLEYLRRQSEKLKAQENDNRSFFLKNVNRISLNLIRENLDCIRNRKCGR